jgi:spore photoproduct lyase
MDEASRTRKTTKFGSVKWVFPREVMKELRGALDAMVARRLPGARVLYWT